MAETIKLDPSAVATSRTEVDISAFISSEGVDWGDAAIEAYMAQGERGSIPVDYSIPNRTVVIPLKLQTRGATSFDTIRRNIQAKVARFQAEGGWMSRQTSVGTLYGDVVNATLRLGGDWLQAHKSVDVNATLTLELVPDWYGAEVSLDDITETTQAAITRVLQLSTSDAVIAGDYPGRVRIVVDEDDAETQKGLLWGFRSRHYSSATTAALRYQAESLTSVDTASSSALTGSSGGNVIRHLTLGEDWTPVLNTRIASGAAQMTHTGTYRVWARVWGDSSGQIQVRFVWDVGDITQPNENAPVTIPSHNPHLADLGEIRLDSPPVGTHSWRGQIQAKQYTTGGTEVYVDELYFQPIDDGAGRLATSTTADVGLVAYTIRDLFDQSAGALSGKTPTYGFGVTWSGAGDTDDFAVETTGKTAQRTTVSDTDPRFGIAGTPTYTGVVAVQADVKWSAGTTMPWLGVFARYSSTTSHVIAMVVPDGSVYVRRRTGVGVHTDLAVESTSVSANTWYTIRFLVDIAGRFWVWFGLRGSTLGEPLIVGYDSGLASGGAEDEGTVGIYDYNSDVTASTRNYDNFAVWIPEIDAVLNASQSAELRTDGMFRENADGSAYGPIAPVSGGLPRIPVSGLESRKVELFLKGSRGDFDRVMDDGIDDISARVHYRPSWLIAPGS